MPLGDYLFRRHVGARSGASAGAASLSYRPDIDGLRAIAVLAVIAYHAVPAWLPGGFTGVDIFFVISGYLITGLMLRDAEHGGFNIRTFYARRMRRIFPALIAVLTVALAAGWYWLLPAEFVPLAKSTAAAAGFVANVQFWREAGYFDSAAELKPLLHLWSLAVEEQFYLVCRTGCGHVLVDRKADTYRQRPHWRHAAGVCHGAGAVGRFAGEQRGFQATPSRRAAEAIQCRGSRLAISGTVVRTRTRPVGDKCVDRRARPAEGARVG